MGLRSIGLALALFPAVIAVPAAAQSSGLECDDFDLVGGDRSIDVIDHAPDGNSPGDTRVGLRELFDADGERVGEADFVSTIPRPSAEDDHLFTGDFQIILPDGVVFGTSVYRGANVVNQTSPAVTVTVSGGSGAYEGASGSVVIGPGDTPDYDFRLTCD